MRVFMKHITLISMTFSGLYYDFRTPLKLLHASRTNGNAVL